MIPPLRIVMTPVQHFGMLIAVACHWFYDRRSDVVRVHGAMMRTDGVSNGVWVSAPGYNSGPRLKVVR